MILGIIRVIPVLPDAVHGRAVVTDDERLLWDLAALLSRSIFNLSCRLPPSLMDGGLSGKICLLWIPRSGSGGGGDDADAADSVSPSVSDICLLYTSPSPRDS